MSKNHQQTNKNSKTQTGLKNWIEYRLPIFSFINKELIEYKTPKNLNYFWNFGSLSGITLVIMIMTGIFLAMQYTPHIDHAFNSVERIMREVNFGWMIRYIHMNGASMFFIIVYIHMFRGLYYGSYKSPRELLWILGVVIFFLMMATAFMGYVLPWGQMSFWGATVITNFFTAFDINFTIFDINFSVDLGTTIMQWLLGGFSVDNPTLNRFFVLHYLLPFLIIAVVILHLVALHQHGSNNPLGIDADKAKDTIPFHPYYTYKDLFGLGIFLIIWAFFVFFAPNFFGEPDNYVPADPLVTPPHIVPEWYFLPFYAILRSVPNKLAGVLLMFSAVSVLAIVPWLDKSPIRSAKFRPLYKYLFWLFVVDCLVLGWVGSQPPEGIAYTIGRITTVYYFAHFFAILPLLNIIERPIPLPKSIHEYEVSKKKKQKKILGILLLFCFFSSEGLANKQVTLKAIDWGFTGPFGTFDRKQLQRGLQVYKEVCSTCHGLNLLRYEKLADLGFSKNEIKAIAAQDEIPGHVNDDGEETVKKAEIGNSFAKPYKNEQLARASNNGALPPDLSLIIKARTGGANYLYSLLTGYLDPPANIKVMEDMYYNAYFEGKQIAMIPPLTDGQVTYGDGTNASVKQMAKDVTAFLAWVSEPESEYRRQLGIKVILYLIFFTCLMYLLMRRVWKKIKILEDNG